MRLILYLCLIIFTFSSSVKSISPQYGVTPEELDYYKDNGKGVFNCLRSNKQIPFSQVNDDYCDCPDGTDEPGTSACSSNGHFWCNNKGYKGMFISSSFVNDGVCDCCDGSDEYKSSITCVNKCKELGDEMKKKHNEEVERYNKGISEKKKLEEEASKTMKEKLVSLDSLRKEIDPINGEIKELEVLVERKKSEKEQEEKRLKDEKEQKDKDEKKDEEAQDEKEIVEKSATSNNNDNNDNNNNDNGEETKPEENKDDVPIVEEKLTSELLETVTKDLSGLESELSKKRESLKQKQEEIEKIEKLLSYDTGVNNVFLPLYGKCFDFKTKEYTYTVCPFDKASQGHTSLGKFETWKDGHNQMFFDGGQQCWGGPKRSIKVYMECGSENELYDVNEPGKCEYTIKFRTPAMCSEEHLKVLKLESDHGL